MKQFKLIIAALFVSFTLSNCGSNVIPFLGNSNKNRVKLIYGRAVAPANAPIAVKRAVAAGNALQRKPYRMGGGHANHNDYAYDCSGSVSYVLRNAGLMRGSMPSRGFKSYGRRGHGDWITIYARDNHVFMTIGGLRLDARGSDHGYAGGPRWLPAPRSIRGHKVRHPKGY
jgi:hypothetical protein